MPFSIIHPKPKVRLHHYDECMTHLYISYKWTVREYKIRKLTLAESVERVAQLKLKYPSHTIKVIERL